MPLGARCVFPSLLSLSLPYARTYARTCTKCQPSATRPLQLSPINPPRSTPQETITTYDDGTFERQGEDVETDEKVDRKLHRRNTAMINQDILETTMGLGLADDKESEIVIKKMVDLVRVLRE